MKDTVVTPSRAMMPQLMVGVASFAWKDAAVVGSLWVSGELQPNAERLLPVLFGRPVPRTQSCPSRVATA